MKAKANHKITKRNFDHIVKEELDAAAPSGCGIQPQSGQPPAEDGIQPSHAKNFILEEVPNGFNHMHKLAPIILSN